MLKTINIELKYDEQDEKFEPISITYESESHKAKIHSPSRLFRDKVWHLLFFW